MDIEQAIAVCALRMDGYRYMESLHPELCGESMPHFAPLVDPVVETLTLHENLNDNFAAFFFLNRSFHWGGEHLTKYSRDHIAYATFFWLYTGWKLPMSLRASSGTANGSRNIDLVPKYWQATSGIAFVEKAVVGFLLVSERRFHLLNRGACSVKSDPIQWGVHPPKDVNLF